MKQFLKKLGYEVSPAKLANYGEGSGPVPHASCPPREADKERVVAAVPSVLACALLPTTLVMDTSLTIAFYDALTEIC